MALTDDIIDVNKVRWKVTLGTEFPAPLLHAQVDPKGPRVYGVSFDPDTAPDIVVENVISTGARAALEAKVNAFAKSSEGDIILLVTASPDKPGDGLGALLLLALVLLALDSKR